MRKLYGRLIIDIKSATNLPNSDYFSGLSDPYCIVLLDDSEIGRTDVCQDEANPVWNKEIFVNLNGEGKNIIFQIWDADRARTDDLLATLEVPLNSIASIKPTCEEQISETTAELQNENGEPTGTLSYSMKLREFGGEFAQFKNDGTKRALQIGINYVNKEIGKGGVTGCQEDIDILNDMLTNRYGFSEENIRILTDQEGYTFPTRKNIEKSIRWLVSSAKPGDSLIFQYSGHGGQVKDKNGDEEDNFDETILPYDHERAGQITDDELHRMLIEPLPHGVLLTCIMDCCHSGTSMDLPFVHVLDTEESERDFDGFVEKELLFNDNHDPTITQLGGGYKPTKHRYTMKARAKRKNAAVKSNKKYDNTSDASVVMISGCLDEQTSVGTQAGGAMVLAFTKVIESSNGDITYRDLVLQMRDVLKRQNYAQIPQLSTARPFNLDSKLLI